MLDRLGFVWCILVHCVGSVETNLYSTINKKKEEDTIFLPVSNKQQFQEY